MTLKSPANDPRALRHALGQFATGVTVVTALDTHGQFTGLTVNSFSSVSLDPPLVSWCLALTSSRYEAFRNARYFAVNVLAETQDALALRFARREQATFDGLQVESGIGGVPLLDGVLANFECETVARHRAGDHDIFLGTVLRVREQGGAPLIFHTGRFTGLPAADEWETGQAERTAPAARPARTN